MAVREERNEGLKRVREGSGGPTEEREALSVVGRYLVFCFLFVVISVRMYILVDDS